MNGYIAGFAQANAKGQSSPGQQAQRVQPAQMTVQEKRRAVACMREAMAAAAAAENDKKAKKKAKGKKNGQGKPDDWLVGEWEQQCLLSARKVTTTCN